MKYSYLAAAVLAISLISVLGFSATQPKLGPDLIVSKIRIDSSKMKKSGKVTIVYTVKNIGSAAARPSHAKIEAVSPEPKSISLEPTPLLPPGGEYTGTATYVIASSKKYQFKATADYRNIVDESNELNNSNSVRFSIGRAF